MRCASGSAHLRFLSVGNFASHQTQFILALCCWHEKSLVSKRISSIRLISFPSPGANFQPLSGGGGGISGGHPAMGPPYATMGGGGMGPDSLMPRLPGGGGVHGVAMPIASKTAQTDIAMENMEKFAASASETDAKDQLIEEQTRQNEELNRQITAQTRLIEKQKEGLFKCIAMIRDLLIEKSNFEKKETRHKTMENRLRLGQVSGNVASKRGFTYLRDLNATWGILRNVFIHFSLSSIHHRLSSLLPLSSFDSS